MSTNKPVSLISRSASNLLRILFESLVLIHHLANPQIPILRGINGQFGPMAVSGFILMSGFGIGLSFKKRGESYLKRLIRQRIPRNYGLIVLTNFFYLLLFAIEENEFNGIFGFLVSILYLPFFKDFQYLSHWVYFLADQCIYYFMFFVMGHLMKKRKDPLLKATIGVFAMQALIVLVVTVINAVTGNTGSLRGCFMFPVGLLIANYSDELASVVHRYKNEIVGGLFLVGTIFFLCLDTLFMNEYVTSGILALTLFFAFHGFSIRSHVLDISSHLILVVYLSHELVFKSLRHMFPSMFWVWRMGYTLAIVGSIVLLLYFIIYKKGLFIVKKRAMLKREVPA